MPRPAGGFCFAGKKVLLTYSRSGPLDKPALHAFLEGKLKQPLKVKMCHEHHQDGAIHTHCCVLSEGKMDIQSESLLDFEGIHPNIKPPMNIEHWCNQVKYMEKEDPDVYGEIEVPKEKDEQRADHDEPTQKAPAECVICAEHLGTMAFTCPACNNTCYHLACILKWAHRASTCPLCRAELPPAVAPPRDVAHLLWTFRGTNAVHYIITDSADDAGFAMVDDALALSLAIESDHQARAQAPTTSFASPASADGAVADPFARIDAELDAAARLIAPVYRL